MNTHPTRPDSNARIAVAGAGIAGLGAARHLQANGYHNVVLFEKAAEVGGKIHTYIYQQRPYELGALISNHDFKHVRAWAQTFGLETFAAQAPLLVQEHGDYLTYKEVIQKRYGYMPFARAAGHFLADNRAQLHTTCTLPTQLPPDLCQPLRDYAAQHRVEAATECLRSFMTGCGYGYYDEVPAAYLLKLLPMALKELLASGLTPWQHSGWSFFTDGWQTLCRRMASELTVRLATPITAVHRSPGTGLMITAGGDTTAFDHLIVAMPLDEALGILDATSCEQQLFSRIVYNRYLVTLVEAEGLCTLGFDHHVSRATSGHLNFVVQQYPDTKVFQLYQLLSANMTIEEADALAAQDIAAVKGRITRIITHREWRYFPHVGPEDLAAGFYGQLDALQGVNATYYAGGLLNLETVEHCLAHASALVNRFFPPLADKRVQDGALSPLRDAT